ncbi:phage portal protein [Kerstersia gyiorum]|uniref:phage portal protein n=1 Tax=Kerstersia gyiorum TaxID=206506 RepID=UPI00214FEC15|nr:phage portal protein [Kerstersia gyiorum]MCR4158815.1 phage portal protein [Kerstersia gyiorum]
MGFFSFFRRSGSPDAGARPSAQAPGITFDGLNDPALLEYIRSGAANMPGMGSNSLRNMAILRCAMLISNSIGMLPLNLMKQGKERILATDHAAYRLLKRKPNSWQTPMEFKSLLQLHALIHGNGYARIVWSRGRPIALVPMDPLSTTPRLDGFSMVYLYVTPDGRQVELPAKEVFHLRDISLDGVSGKSRIKLAGGAIELARQAEEAAKRVFRTGVMAGGAIEVDKELSEQAYMRLKQSIGSEVSGSENAGKWFLLEDGAKANKFAVTSADAQQIENRNHQIEEVARLFGVPRPLLMMDDTSWGSGIEQLAIFFIQYTLAPWFVAWEQALSRSLLSEAEMDSHAWKYNERALMRGTLKDQADFFAKAMGAGGQAPWMTQNEVRDLADLPRSDDPNADKLRNPMTQKESGDGKAKN